MIELYASGTPNVMKVLFMLGETELPYEIHPVNVFAGEQFEPVFRALNPNSKVPVIVDRRHGDLSLAVEISEVVNWRARDTRARGNCPG